MAEKSTSSKTGQTRWSDEEMVWLLNESMSGGSLDPNEFMRAWREALRWQGREVEVGSSGRTIEVHRDGDRVVTR